MRGTSFIHLVFGGLFLLIALLQITFHDKWMGIVQSVNAARWHHAKPGDKPPQDRLRQYKISEKIRAAD
jgi:hypothetical protein